MSESTYIKLPCQSKNSMKGLINIKNHDNKYFLWDNIRHLNPLKRHPEKKKTKADKKMVNDLDCEGIDFSVSKKDFSKIKRKIKFPLTCYVLEINCLILFMYQIENLKVVYIYY